MSEEQKHYRQLVATLLEHAKAYYQDDAPKISDAAYDRLYQQVKNIETAHPEWTLSYSPTQRIGAEPLKVFEKVERKQKMYSLDNTYSLEELSEFVQRVFKSLEKTNVAFVVEPKVDGLAIELVYENGELTLGATRGDGMVGENITQNVKTIRDLPLFIAAFKNKEKVALRGEVYIEREDLAKINEERIKEGSEAFKNPRNAAAGSLRLLDSKVTARRPLKIIVYQLLGEDRFEFHHEIFEFFRQEGIPTHTHVDLMDTDTNLKSLIDGWAKSRLSYAYDLDGLVFKVNSIQDQKSLGHTAKYPRWAISYKFKTEQAQTLLQKIETQVGRTGVITPIAVLSPVELGGTTVSKASLHNFDEIKNKDLREGDLVLIEKAGEIIPQVISVCALHADRPSRKFKIPTQCPSCGSVLGKSKDEQVALQCLNHESCPAQQVERIVYFCSRSAVNIDKVGPALIQQLFEKGLIQDSADLFGLKADDLLKLDRMAEKSSENVVTAISQAKAKMSLADLLTGLGIPLIGRVAAEAISKRFESLEQISFLPIEEQKGIVDSIQGLGPKMVEAYASFLESTRGKRLIQKFLSFAVNPKVEGDSLEGTQLSGLSFCVSGTLSRPRNEIKALIQAHGGKFVSAISSKTDFLLLGENTGASKKDKAHKLGVKQITEDELFQMMEVDN